MTFETPVLLSGEHDVEGFESGVPALDDWLRRRALSNQLSGASRTYVALVGDRIAGYYALAAGSASPADSPGRVRRNMSDPIPVMMLGRLATDLRFRGQGVGAGLLKDAVLRTIQVSKIAGIRAVAVDAIDDAAIAFYRKFGFLPSPTKPLKLFLPLSDADRQP